MEPCAGKIRTKMIDQYTYLAGALEDLDHEFCFSHHIGNGKIIPTDEVHHFSEGLNRYHQPDTPCDCGSPQPDPLLGPQNIFIKNPTIDFLQNVVPWIQNSISIYFLGCIQKLLVGFPSTKKLDPCLRLRGFHHSTHRPEVKEVSNTILIWLNHHCFIDEITMCVKTET